MTMPLRKIFPVLSLFLAIGLIACGIAAAQEVTTSQSGSTILDETDGSWKNDDGSPIVVELFTATNCSACMPADRILYDIAKMKNVIALGCHINYWDEHTLGDPTGLEECTYRQWAYRSSGMFGGTNIRVPHFMINGLYSVDNANTNQFYNRLQQARKSSRHKPGLVYMEWVDEDTLRIHMPAATRKINNDDSFSVWLIRYQDQMIQKVDMGQTAGRVLRFTNVVREAKHIAKWHGKVRVIEVDVDKPKDGPERGGYATLIHLNNGSEVVAAGKVADYKVAADDKAKPKVEAPITGPLLQ